MQNDVSTATVTGRVQWVDTDASGHQHNSLIMRLAEAAEAELMEAEGIRKAYFAVAPRVRHEINYEGKLYFGQGVTATIVLERLGRSSITFSFEVWGEEFEGRPRHRAASGLWVAAHVPSGSESAAPWPEAIVAALHPREPRTR